MTHKDHAQAAEKLMLNAEKTTLIAAQQSLLMGAQVHATLALYEYERAKVRAVQGHTKESLI